MANKLSDKKIKKMFNAFCEKESNSYVSKKCKVSTTTVRRYRNSHNWDERIEEIKKKARQKEDEKRADYLAENIKTVRFAKSKVLKAMQAGEVKLTGADLDRYIRLELFLRGEADSRPEFVNKELQQLSTEKLLEMKERLEGSQKDDDS